MLLQCFAERVDGPLLFASPLASFFLRGRRCAKRGPVCVADGNVGQRRTRWHRRPLNTPASPPPRQASQLFCGLGVTSSAFPRSQKADMRPVEGQHVVLALAAASS